MFLKQYLLSGYALVAVVLPWLLTITWYFAEGRKHPPRPRVIVWWMLTVAISYWCAQWTFTEDTVSLHIIDTFIFYMLVALYARERITPGCAFALSFLGLWIVDMVHAAELIPVMWGWNTFYLGVGGAGLRDGLIVFPTLAGLLVYYVEWRQRMMAE